MKKFVKINICCWIYTEDLLSVNKTTQYCPKIHVFKDLKKMYHISFVKKKKIILIRSLKFVLPSF